METEKGDSNIKVLWPEISPIFEQCSSGSQNVNVSFKCLICLPNVKYIKASVSTASNLRTHIKNVHPFKLNEFNNLMSKKGRKRQVDLEESDERKIKKIQTDIKQYSSGLFKSKKVTEEQKKAAVVRFIVGTGSSFSLVEHPDFVNMINVYDNGQNPTNRKILMESISESFDKMISALKETLNSISFVCTTADCWTVFKRSYLGMTVHWIDPNTLTRESRGLACRRMFGSHTYDNVANVIEGILDEFSVKNKTTVMVTDSGSNFVKAFRVYGSESINQDSDSNSDDEDNDDELVATVEINDILDQNEDYGRLPPHHRCVAHSLNLLATKDTEQAEKDSKIYKKVSRQVFGKCQALFNKQNQSSKAGDSVKTVLGRYLLVPGSTRWNSFYEAIDTIRVNENKIDEVCKMLDLPTFKRPQDFDFLQEYCMVMKPVAKALDYLQGDNGMYMGYMLPVLAALKNKIESMGGLEYCEGLKAAILNGYEKRFSPYFLKDEYKLASVLIPKFKHMKWISKESAEQVRKGMENVAKRHFKSATVKENPKQEKDDDDDDFFDTVLNEPEASCSGSAQQELSNYFQSSADKITDLSQNMRKLFIRYNTAVPSSAHCERLFSAGGLIFSERRGRMTDANFEKQLLLRFNKYFQML